MPDISVQWEEMAGYPQEERSRDGFSATRMLKVAWADRFTARDELLAFPGMPYPYSSVDARCTNVAARPFDGGATFGLPLPEGSGELAVCEHALLTVRYETPSSDVATQDPNGTPGDMISEDWSPGLEYITMPYKAFRWASGSGDELQPEEAPGLRVEVAELRFTRHHLPATPAIMTQLQGKTNSAPLTTRLLGITCAIETLKFENFHVAVVANGLGQPRLTVTALMLWRSTGWNKFYRAKTQAWTDMFIAGGAIFKPYPPASFAGL